LLEVAKARRRDNLESVVRHSSFVLRGSSEYRPRCATPPPTVSREMTSDE
jgi:hypothetical protein